MSYGEKFYKATDITAVSLCGYEVKSLFQQLGSINQRKVDYGLF